MRLSVIAAIILACVVQSFAGDFGNNVGTAYLTKNDGVKIYSSDTGDEIDDTANKNFLIVAYDARGTLHAMAGNTYVMANPNISNGRLHVRYFKNGKDRSDGENTAWVNPDDVQRFTFDCCADRLCSGIKPRMFATTVYAECLISARDKQLESTPAAQSDELKKLKLQVELEKIRLEREKLQKTGAQ